MNVLPGLLLVARRAFRRAFGGRRIWLLLLLLLLPVAMATLAVLRQRANLPNFLQLVALVMLQTVVPFVALLMGTAVLGDEIEGRTIPYLFSRPLPRWVFFLGRYLGFLGALGLLFLVSTSVSLGLFAGPLALALSQMVSVVAIVVAGFAVYLAFFATLRAVFQKALYAGFLIVFIVEITLSKLPFGGLTRWSVWHHLIVLLKKAFPGTPPSAFPGLKLVPPDATAAESWLVLGCVWAVSLALGAWLVKTREIRVAAAVS